MGLQCSRTLGFGALRTFYFYLSILVGGLLGFQGSRVLGFRISGVGYRRVLFSRFLVDPSPFVFFLSSVFALRLLVLDCVVLLFISVVFLRLFGLGLFFINLRVSGYSDGPEFRSPLRVSVSYAESKVARRCRLGFRV